MSKKLLQLQQLQEKISYVPNLQQVITPPSGWIKAIRTSLGMSMQQLGSRLSITKQGVLDMEKREKEGSITIKALSVTAKALDMELVYGFVPKDGSLDALIERKARELATKIVLRTNQSMKLEEQGNSKIRIEKAINERTMSIKNEMPKILWD